MILIINCSSLNTINFKELSCNLLLQLYYEMKEVVLFENSISEVLTLFINSNIYGLLFIQGGKSRVFCYHCTNLVNLIFILTIHSGSIGLCTVPLQKTCDFLYPVSNGL